MQENAEKGNSAMKGLPDTTRPPIEEMDDSAILAELANLEKSKEVVGGKIHMMVETLKKVMRPGGFFANGRVPAEVAEQVPAKLNEAARVGDLSWQEERSVFKLFLGGELLVEHESDGWSYTVKVANGSYPYAEVDKFLDKALKKLEQKRYHEQLVDELRKAREKGAFRVDYQWQE